jgi:CHRD domain-containing protein
VNGTLSTENLEGPLVGKQISELLDLFDMGEAYVNIHTAANPDGEIRGTIQQG